VVVIILEEERKLVKIQFNAKTGQCHVSIPRAFWDSVTGTGYLMATLQDGNLVYTPASKQMKKDTKIPKFLQENDGGESGTSSQEVTKTETIQEQQERAKKNIDPNIKIDEEPDVWADDGNESSTD
jgi:hypothetical protein